MHIARTTGHDKYCKLSPFPEGGQGFSLCVIFLAENFRSSSSDNDDRCTFDDRSLAKESGDSVRERASVKERACRGGCSGCWCNESTAEGGCLDYSVRSL